MAEDLWNAGLRGINISLDSLDPARFNTLLGAGPAPQLVRGFVEGIQAATGLAFRP